LERTGETGSILHASQAITGDDQRETDPDEDRRHPEPEGDHQQQPEGWASRRDRGDQDQ
jgi:hypothetical protein